MTLNLEDLKSWRIATIILTAVGILTLCWDVLGYYNVVVRLFTSEFNIFIVYTPMVFSICGYLLMRRDRKQSSS
ncbi:MAG: hypothetical protein QXJ75_00395 [Candidatus Bathyarchaeia archaeon]